MPEHTSPQVDALRVALGTDRDSGAEAIITAPDRLPPKDAVRMLRGAAELAETDEMDKTDDAPSTT